jgi:hypothetical protein
MGGAVVKQQNTKTTAGKCNLAAGSAVAGSLLFAILYWKPTRQIGGHWWIAKPRRQLMQESGFTLKQVKSGLPKLRSKRMIATRQYPFQGKNVLHIRVTEEGYAAVGLTPPWPDQVAPAEPAQPFKEAPNGSASVSPNGSGAVSPNGSTLYMHRPMKTLTHNTDKENSSRINPLAKNASGLKQDSEEDQQCLTNEKNACASAPENEEAMSKHSKSVYDVVAARKGKTLLHKPDSAKALGRLWLSLVSEHHGPTVQNLNGKQHDQLKNFILAMPDGKAPEILELVITNWKEFTSHSKDEAGAFGIPSKPTLDFLLKYVQCAVSYAASSPNQQEAPIQAGPKVNLQSIAISACQPKKAPYGKPADGPQTNDELIALMNAPIDYSALDETDPS